MNSTIDKLNALYNSAAQPQVRVGTAPRGDITVEISEALPAEGRPDWLQRLLAGLIAAPAGTCFGKNDVVMMRATMTAGKPNKASEGAPVGLVRVYVTNTGKMRFVTMLQFTKGCPNCGKEGEAKHGLCCKKCR